MSIEPVAEKLSKLLKLLSSPHDAEALGAARVEELKLSEAEMQRIYDQAYRDGRDAAAADVDFSSVDPPSFYEMAKEIEYKDDGHLNAKEREFVGDMVRWCARREPSEKQAKWLHAIYCRIERRR